LGNGLINTITGLLTQLQHNPSHISPSAYDTAWLAWLYPEAKEWLLEAQHPDGSWGSNLEYYHDRVIATLAAVNALAATSTNGHDLSRMEQGLRYVERALLKVDQDVHDTTAFELLLPTLVKIGQNLGLNLTRIEPLLAGQKHLLEKKLALIPPEMLYSPQTVVPYSLEFIGFEKLDREAVARLRSANGSIHDSPSATAFAEAAVQGTPQGRAYLNEVVRRYNGTAPGFTPLELFEIIWILYHISLVVDLKSLRPTVAAFIAHLQQAWTKRGVGFSITFPIPDPDDTALAFKILSDLEIYQDPTVFEVYEFGDHFQCYPLERNISLDVHIHIVDALKETADFPRRDDLLLKALNILGRDLTTEYIVDKWHVSPYYSTAHAILSLTGLSDQVIQKQIKWLLNTQHEDGRWTFYPACPKAAIEETAHTLLALMTVFEKRGNIPFGVIERGIRYLEKHYRSAEELPALWINKVLYNPYHIVETVIITVMVKYQQLVTRRKQVRSKV
jgi:halimadienyl-diphosphate synthase